MPLSIVADLNDRGIGAGTPMTRTSASFTPSNNVVLVVFVGTVDSTSSNVSAGSTLTGGGLVWTKQASRDNSGGTPTYWQTLEIWTASVVTGAAMTLTWTRAAGASVDSAVVFQVFEISHAADSPFAATAAAALPLDGPALIPLSSYPRASSIIVAGRCAEPTDANDVTATPALGWTELYDTGGTPSGYTCLQTQWITATWSNLVGWDDVVAAGTAAHTADGLALEVQNLEPTINTQPADTSAYAGTTAAFTVSATASSGVLSYQWQVSNNRGASYSDVVSGSGATTSSYTTPTIAFSDHETFYRCNVTDSNDTVATRGALLRVIPNSAQAWTKA